jgi:hypothetical protein
MPDEAPFNLPKIVIRENIGLDVKKSRLIGKFILTILQIQNLHILEKGIRRGIK